ncbi:hypothetical protein ABB37_03677 [Leptomonas pyrrhocoris]|uniref:Very-long-chain 3-oxoacyl-CoA synthase n=1 Tax=Leptomonas pyrrhocoris TaxID=157538 RepID=A0A0N0DW45_LEPPY|nr:hypothetical protein ABB37_03677 [Leptomonas pyrrhocoris]KPA81264.1 hypothetical protein ABB37_03677 [Leptomonas pyrrhocoris]|eukprot:XP_015659703.1 hypothetical protein ABB37_03677 [Leptomonas pyrrhocoris]
MMLVQWYTGALLCVDAYELYRLWTASPRMLSNGACWFDASSNAPMALALYTALLLCLMLARLFVLIEPLSRWMLMLETIHDGIRVLLYSALFTAKKDASQANTMLIAFAVWNTFFYGRAYYTTMVMLREHSK